MEARLRRCMSNEQFETQVGGKEGRKKGGPLSQYLYNILVVCIFVSVRGMWVSVLSLVCRMERVCIVSCVGFSSCALVGTYSVTVLTKGDFSFFLLSSFVFFSYFPLFFLPYFLSFFPSFLSSSPPSPLPPPPAFFPGAFRAAARVAGFPPPPPRRRRDARSVPFRGRRHQSTGAGDGHACGHVAGAVSEGAADARYVPAAA